MPKMSSRRLTAATAPLIAKTKVPPKSRMLTKVSMVIMPASPAKAECIESAKTCKRRHVAANAHRRTTRSSCSYPGQRAYDERLDAGLHGRMQDRRELWAVVDR